MDQSSETRLRLSTTLPLLGKNTQFQNCRYWNETQNLLDIIDKILGRSSALGHLLRNWIVTTVLIFYLVDCRSKDSRYDDMGHLESNNNKPMDKPLNLETKSERRLSSTDKDSGNTHYVLALSLCAKLNINLFFFLLIRDDKF